MLACTTTPPSFCPIDAIGTRTASATGGAASEKVLVPDSPAPDPRLSSYALNECPPSPTALDLFAPHPQTPSSGAPTHLSLQTVSQENGAKDAPRVLVADSPQPLPPQKDHSTTGLLEPKLNPTKKKSSFMSKFINANPEVSANKSGHQPTNRQGFPIRLSSGRPCTELNQNNLKAKPTSNKSTLMKALGLKQQSKAKLDSSYLARMKEAGDLKIAIAGRSLEGDADVSRRKNTDTGSSDRQSKAERQM
ncbi:hypothetical protein BC830DRAFT_425654 [Chytriomyces sp. MP71]|nr:hypothetical protein BC830DRAFT_425654 [Chytriomyces sp. MP71]